MTGNYTPVDGISLLGAGGLVPVTPTPGVNDFITFGGTSYGGGISVTPMRRLVISGSFNRAISDTVRTDALAQQHRNLQCPDAVPSAKNRAAGGLYAIHPGHQRRGSARQHDVVFCRDIQMVRFLLTARGRSAFRSGLIVGRAGDPARAGSGCRRQELRSARRKRSHPPRPICCWTAGANSRSSAASAWSARSSPSAVSGPGWWTWSRASPTFITWSVPTAWPPIRADASS